MIAFGILGMCNWLARWYKPDKEVSIEQLIDTYFNLVSQGLNQNTGDALAVAASAQALPPSESPAAKAKAPRKTQDRKSAVKGKSGPVQVELGGRGIIKKKKQ